MNNDPEHAGTQRAQKVVKIMLFASHSGRMAGALLRDCAQVNYRVGRAFLSRWRVYMCLCVARSSGCHAHTNLVPGCTPTDGVPQVNEL